jgi:hypothetical protein
VLPCTADTTLDDFGNGILIGEDGDDYFSSSFGKTKDDVCAGSRMRGHGLIRAVFAHLGHSTIGKEEDAQVSEAV